MPNFDDVADMIDQAVADLIREATTGDLPMTKMRSWTFGTARLAVSNPNKYDGLGHRMLIQFLNGFHMSGSIYGFFEVQMDFVDTSLTLSGRGSAILERSDPTKIVEVLGSTARS